MTVAAVVLPASAEQALADAAGRLAVRRIVDAAWAGGALPIIVVLADADGAISAALEGSPARLVDPRGAVGLAAAGIGVAAALEAVRETSAMLLWPGRMAWTDPETITSLIEAHGRRGGQVTRPSRAGEVGWPVLLPADRALAILGAGVRTLDELVAGVDAATVELGDPGSVLGLEVRIDELPDYAGPPEPVGGPPPEWGAAAAETPEPEVPPRSPEF
jgi:hypothetical protein